MGRTPTGETRRKVFEFVRDRLLAGQPPTVREVQDAFGFRAVQTARQHLERLVEDGRLMADRHKARGYRLPGAAREPRIVLVPMLGRVPAGVLEEAVVSRPACSKRRSRIRTATCRWMSGVRRPAICSR